MISRLLIAGMAFLMLSCGSKSKEPPNDILQPSQFKGVITDLLLAEGGTTKNLLKPDSSRKDLLLEYNKVALAHNLTTAQIYSSLEWYVRNPEVFKPVLDGAVDSLGAIQSRLGR